MQKQVPPLGHWERMLSLRLATVVVRAYLLGPISVPSYNRNFTSKSSVPISFSSIHSIFESTISANLAGNPWGNLLQMIILTIIHWRYKFTTERWVKLSHNHMSYKQTIVNICAWEVLFWNSSLTRI